MNNLLIIRGAPGVGKSSVGKMLATRYKFGVTIEIDEVRRMINSVSWAGEKEHLDAIDAARHLSISYFNSGYDPIMVIDTLGMGMIGAVLCKLPVEVNYKIISLFAQNEVIKSRILKRSGGFMNYDLSFKINTSIEKEKLNSNYLIDTSNSSITEVVDKIIEIIQL
jgi:broad-specificity NMP kinase